MGDTADVESVRDGWTALFDAVPDVVAWVDRELRYRYVNRSIETVTGLDASRFPGRTNEEIGLPAALSAPWQTHLTEVIHTGHPTLFEFDVDTPGGLRRFQSVATPIPDTAGQIESIFVISRDITETRAIHLLEGAVHHLPTGVALVEAPSGRLLLRNSQATDIFRMTPTPASGVEGYRRFVGFRADGHEYQPADWPLARSIQAGEVVTGEIAEILRGDGTRGFIRMTSAPVRNSAGDIIAGVVTFDDITDVAIAERQRRVLEQASGLLSESLDRAVVLERLAQLAVPTIADWCIVHTMDHGEARLAAVEHADPAKRGAARTVAERYALVGESAVSRVLQGGAGELLATITEDTLRAAARDEEHLARLLAAGYRSAIVVPMRGRSGVIGSLTFVAAESGRIFDQRDLAFCDELACRAALAIENARLYDEARTAEAAQTKRADELRTLEERLRLAVDGANVGLWHYEIATDRLIWDERTRDQFGIAHDQPVDTDTFYGMVHPDDRQRLLDAFNQALASGSLYDMEYRIGSPDAPRWIRSRARAGYDAAGVASRFDGITLDITAQKIAEAERVELLARERAARADSEAALLTRDEFIAAASHELRNPLNALQLQLAGLHRAARRDPASLAAPAMTARLAKAEGQVTRLVRLVETLLDVSRIKSGRLDLESVEVDLVALAREVIAEVQPGFDEQPIQLTAPETIAGQWDPLRLGQVLTNLLSNALKYGNGKPVGVTLSADQSTATIAVADDGIGISPDQLPKLFARFERLTPDHRRGGFGLGLWITRQIVAAFGGRIDVRSELGRGSIFVVGIPRDRPAVPLETGDHAVR